ncbi:MAG: deoxyhypusine synthase family protein [Deltaproteobacteria bacterium]|nr:deoxyhypusine synthase family protein [Deltaproteobacteria bacterium]
MKRYEPVDLEKTITQSVSGRKTKVDLSSFAKPAGKRGASFREFFDSLPGFLAARSLRETVKSIKEANSTQSPVILGIGAHVIKVGLSPLIIDLMKRGIINCVAMNGAGAIHDFEIAATGRTSEDVGEGLETGMFGMAEETMRDMNLAISCGDKQAGEKGMGRILGENIMESGAPFNDMSILAAGALLDIPVTVHVALGTDTIHMSGHADPKAIGETSFNDFRLLISVVCDLDGGVYLNVGSAVILPEVFMKAVNVARNLGSGIRNFTAVNMDMQQHYRPVQNVLCRTGAKAISLTGHHEIMIPLIYQALIDSDWEK